MTNAMKKANVKAAIVGVIGPLADQLGFEYSVNTDVEHYQAVVELVVKAELTLDECGWVNGQLNLIKTDGAITFIDNNGFH